MKGINFIVAAILLISAATISDAQTSAFTYQGRFTDGGTAANGTYDMQFKLFDGASNQIGSTITNGAVTVTNGVFTVQLDYGVSAFSGADRFLEIGVRSAGSGDSYTVLSPRQQLTSAVYAIRAGTTTTADNANQLGGVAASLYVQTNDSRMTDSRSPTAGSSNYIQNSISQQPANLNISGNGTAGGTFSGNVINAATQFNLNGTRVLHDTGTGNLFAGASAGSAITSGQRNSFFGTQAGIADAANNDNSFFGNSAGKLAFGSANSFFGSGAGANNAASNNSFFGVDSGSVDKGGYSSFFGFQSGHANTDGTLNSFFGAFSGRNNTTGFKNSFVGYAAGLSNETGLLNSFFGEDAGYSNKSGNQNVFIGSNAGYNNYTGDFNTYVGYLSGYYGTDGQYNTGLGYDTNLVSVTNATAIGAYAKVTKSNSLVLGSIDGINGALADTNVGIGTTAPNARFHVRVNSGNILLGDAGCSPSFVGIGFGSALSGCGNYSLLGNGTDTIVNRPTGGAINFRENNVTQVSIAAGGAVSIATLGAAGSTSLCRNASNQISTCSSSLRYKTNIQPFFGGLSVLNRLRPITFDWKQGGMHDLGFGAEDIAAVEPLLVTRNDKGEVEGVKYDRITAVLVNAVKEQQEQIKRQQSEIATLKSLVCKRNRRAPVCK